MKDSDDVIRILRRTFNGGIMRRLPKKQGDAEALMALSMVGLEADVFYDESEINIHLSAWLDIIGSQDGRSDYVTLRRNLVDFGFLRRASDGAVYRIVAERATEVLSPEAMLVDPKKIFAEVQTDRNKRRTNFGRRD